MSPIQALPADQIITHNKARWGIYGLNGAGKTSFLATIPSSIPTMVVSADDENVGPLAGLKHIKVVKVVRWKELAEILLAFQKAEQDKRPFFQCLAFDTYTRIQALAANKIVGYELFNPGEEAKYIDVAPKLPKGYEAWQQIGALAGEWLRYFCRLPIHAIFLMQELKSEPKTDNDIVEIGPAMTPEARKHVRDALTLVGRLYVDLGGPQGGTEAPIVDLSKADKPTGRDIRTINPNQTETRRLLVGKHETFFSKGDSRRLGYTVEDPTFEKLATALWGGIS